MPSLSIIVPVYNAEKYLNECIDSILAQDYKDFELILVDDGSKDSSPKLCEEYAKKDSRVSVYHVENGGAYNARLFGIGRAKGEYVGFCDSDDYIDSNMYSVLMEDAKKEDADMVCCSYVLGNNNNEPMANIHFCEDGVYKNESLASLLSTMFYNPKTNIASISPSVCIKIFKKESLLSLKRIDDIRIHISEDGIFSYTAALSAKCIVMRTEFRPYHYRENLESTVHNFKPEIFTQVDYVLNYFDVLLNKVENRKYKPGLNYYVFDLYLTAVKGLGKEYCVPSCANQIRKNVRDTSFLKKSLAENKTLKGFDRLRVYLISRKMFGLYFLLKQIRKAV